jgi:menaquinone-dependent protoporphyrinogen oxidase
MNQSRLTRRRFLSLSGLALGTCALVGTGAFLTNADAAELQAPIGFPGVSMGEKTISKNILVTYASAAGSTGGVAEIIGEKLVEKGLYVNIQKVQSVTSLDGYDAVILGSAIHGGKWLPEAIEFLEVNQARLNQIKTLFYLVGLMVNKNTEADRNLVDQFLAPQRALVKPAAEGRFVGALFTRNYPFFVGLGMRFFIAYCGLGFFGGDFRNPTAIRTWAESIYPHLIR